ncbi:hypothetical protein H6P81_012438 [Aristolochia fimbriata]|uniref:F-box domain-containing protein n=1 Tax=Aristolochia fimbriata TaxID=158543 RepID=A0AAV7EBS9_ARIFI|nr:hypothetical protein H6P81_012438 [Aristolochia fimbriata]
MALPGTWVAKEKRRTRRLKIAMQRVRVSSDYLPAKRLGDSQICLVPKFRISAGPGAATAPSWEVESSDGTLLQPIIPGLPDHVALNCLVRVPVENHSVCRAVCRTWRSLFYTKQRFFTWRKILGFHSPWLFLLALESWSGKLQGLLLNLSCPSTWHPVPPIPSKRRLEARSFGCAAIPQEGTLFLCGGMMSDEDCPLDIVLKFEMLKNRWTVVKPMPAARSFFAARKIGSYIYAAGGKSSDVRELNSAQVFDIAKEDWQPIVDMRVAMPSYDSAVLDGKLLVTEGWIWPFMFAPRGQVYDPKIDRWEMMAEGLCEGWTGPSVLLYDHLFVIPEHEEMKLKVYYSETDTWDTVEGNPMPEQISKPFSVNACDSNIFVVGKNLHVALGKVEKQPFSASGSERKRLHTFSVKWQAVPAPESFRGWTPSNSLVHE